MKIILSLFLAILFGVSSAYAAQNDKISNYCEKRWGTDFSMIEACLSTQREARTGVLGYVTEHRIVDLPLEASRVYVPTQIVRHCRKRWADDWGMQLACIEDQDEAARRIGKLTDDRGSNFIFGDDLAGMEGALAAVVHYVKKHGYENHKAIMRGAETDDEAAKAYKACRNDEIMAETAKCLVKTEYFW